LAARRSIYNEYIAKLEYNTIVGTAPAHEPRALHRTAIDMADTDQPAVR